MGYHYDLLVPVHTVSTESGGVAAAAHEAKRSRSSVESVEASVTTAPVVATRRRLQRPAAREANQTSSVVEVVEDPLPSVLAVGNRRRLQRQFTAVAGLEDAFGRLWLEPPGSTRRQLRRQQTDVELLEYGMKRLGLDGVSVSPVTRASAEETERADVDVTMVAEEVHEASMPLVAETTPEPSRVSERTLRADDFVFDRSSEDQRKCLARVWVPDKARPVFAQCTGPPNQDGFCSKHCTEKKRQAHGVWDPPSHASLSERKRAEGGKEAARRASIGARALEVSEVAVTSVRAGSAEASGRGQQRGRGRRGSGAVSAGAALASGGTAVTDSARAEAVSALPPERIAGVRGRGGRGAGSLSSGSAPVVSGPSAESSVARSLVVTPGARGGSKGRGRGGSGSRGGRGDMAAIRAENTYVDDEMRRRGFVVHGGQWRGGQMLPGEPADANLAEAFLRERFRDLRRQEAEAGQQGWGQGRRLDS